MMRPAQTLKHRKTIQDVLWLPQLRVCALCSNGPDYYAYYWGALCDIEFLNKETFEINTGLMIPIIEKGKDPRDTNFYFLYILHLYSLHDISTY